MRITVELSWGEVGAPDLAGYRLYWLSAASKDEGVLTLKTVTKVQLSLILKPKEVYSFFVSSYDVAGNESGRSLLKSVYVV